MGHSNRLRREIQIVTSLLALMLLIVACTSSGSGGGPASSQRLKGGTATWAEVVGSPPNYIFPFDNCGQLPQSITQLQDFMYRPLYWFGGPEEGETPNLNPALSLANPPTYSGRTVTVNLRPYRWSNGEGVTAQDVLFWMNIFKVEKADFCAYVPGYIPDNVTNVTVASPSQIRFTLDRSYSSEWFTYNQLGLLIPLPLAWDITSAGGRPGSGGCASASYASVTVNAKGDPVSAAAKACVAVFDFLSRQAGYDPAHPAASSNAIETYATSPLWQVVDGPWHLASFDSSGKAVFVPNKKYSGPVKPRLSRFVELPFTTASAEYNALLADQVNVGYIPFNNLTAAAPNDVAAGPNNPQLAGKYILNPEYFWGFNFFLLNFNSSGDGGAAGKIFRQLYFRQAMQSLVDQPLILKGIYKNYGSPTYGPVPLVPDTSEISSFEKKNPYPYNVAKARSLLSSHGWKVVPGGTSTCVDPAKCGPGIPAGAQLNFNLQYASGLPALAEEMTTEKAAWAQAGIKINLSSASYNTIGGNTVACSGASCSWEMENGGGGWTYAPGSYPTGEQLTLTGAVSNKQSYSSAANDRLVRLTNTSSSLSDLYNYENYQAVQLPVIYQPNIDPSLTEISRNLVGAVPQNPLSSITPEFWYFVKPGA